MSTAREKDWGDEYSEIGEKPDVGFLDFEDDKSLHNFDPLEGPVVITNPFPFVDGKPQSAFIGETSADPINITNTTSDPMELWSIRIFSSNPENSYILSMMNPPSDDADEEARYSFVGSTYLEDRVLQPGQTLTIWLSCKPKDIGLHTSVIHFDLGHEKIERVVFLLAEDKVSRALFADKPYRGKMRRTNLFDVNDYVAGCRPLRANSRGYRYKLPLFNIPNDIREIIQNNQIPDVLTEGLDNRNYAKFFSTLLVMEEIHLEEEMRAYDMECVTMKRRGNRFVSLLVPGLAERRPSLVCGDYIFAKLETDNPGGDRRPYQGYIHRVEADEIYLRFNDKFHFRHCNDDLYNVSFTYNRVNMRRLYQAVDAAESLGTYLLFPSQSSEGRAIKRSPLKPLNPYLNREQACAVEMILSCKGSPPYVVYGPPGTGKTMTLVEAILQLYTFREKSRVLVCASSNSAADHILDQLLDKDGHGVRENEVFRLNATCRLYEDIKPDLIRFCYFDDMIFQCPPLKALQQYRIIISTYMSASLLYAEGIRRGHFSHIILDEAGQASEPETMIPVANLCVKDTVIVLAGDPMQLGPVVYSRKAENCGLGKSYLDRLFECNYYAANNEKYVTKLVRNYRCHPAILDLPSKLFYKGELIACKEDSYSSIYEYFDLPNKGFPLLFVGIQGCDEREGKNPSWFNRTEASKVVEIVRKLMRSTGIGDNDIGIITPYRHQVLKLKKALELLEMPELKVGSVEQFQGQEREVILISTVRSTVKHDDFDRVHNLGFLSNPRRFNVAITRAKSLLIIVGNPHIITKDHNWDKLLRHCADNGSYQGCPLPPPQMHAFTYDASPDQYAYEQDNPQPCSNDEVEWTEDMPTEQDARWNDPNEHQNDVIVSNDHPTQTSTEVVRWGDYIIEPTGWDDD